MELFLHINRQVNDTPVAMTPSTQMSAASAPSITASLALFKPTYYTISSVEQQQVEVFQEFQLHVDCSQVSKSQQAFTRSMLQKFKLEQSFKRSFEQLSEHENAF